MIAGSSRFSSSKLLVMTFVAILSNTVKLVINNINPMDFPPDDLPPGKNFLILSWISFIALSISWKAISDWEIDQKIEQDKTILLFLPKDKNKGIVLRNKGYTESVISSSEYLIDENENLNIKTIGVETIRERNGLAYSSRNTLLSNNNKSIASMLYKVLMDIELNKGDLSNDLLNTQIKYLTSNGFELDYLAVCDTESLEQSLDICKKDLLVAIAAKLNNVRLIDNIVLTKL